MLQIIKTFPDGQRPLERIEEGCWVNLSCPTPEELARVEQETGVLGEYLRAALDEEERSRIEWDEHTGQALILVDIPRVEKEGDSFVYTTLPFALIHMDEYLITVSLAESPLVRSFQEGVVRGFYTNKKTRFTYQLLYHNASRYLHYLRQIDKSSNRVHEKMQKSYRNKELLQLMALEKSLVYFSTSLKSNEMVLERLIKVNFIQKYPEDQDLLEDVIVENKQAMEMCSIYRDILSGMMDAYASIISNNLNIVMKFLAAVTIVISLPTLVTSAWGMNVRMPWGEHPWGFAIVSGLSVAIAIAAGLIMWRKKMF
ncbi:MAG: magnesium transporter CorA family protein [Clostridiales bacterium]|nr:magnesium transporter CorA family protein [Clostridiales bacterium]